MQGNDLDVSEHGRTCRGEQRCHLPQSVGFGIEALGFRI
jgi:hypothetical protein